MKIAIKAHPLRGKEIISLLESLGGNNTRWEGDATTRTYYIDINNIIRYGDAPKNYKVYTLEEFEAQFPFKVGDKVRHISSIGTIRKYCYIDNKPGYEVESMELGIIANIPAEILKPYKEMKKERNVVLTLDKAREWYKRGGELKEVALQAFTEKELNPLPRSWKEFCEKYPVQGLEAHITSMSTIIEHQSSCTRDIDDDRNICPSMKSAEAHLAMMQLEQLRNCWWNGWKPEWDGSIKYSIHLKNNKLTVEVSRIISKFLVFPTKEMAEEFLECFRDLIEKAGDLI